MDDIKAFTEQSQHIDIDENTPLLSVIIPVYNAGDTVGRAIRSVIDTPFAYEIEVIVVDDCSSDDTVDIVKEIHKLHKNIILYSMPQNSGGPSAPRNLGIEKARGEYVTFLDDDDWVDADRMLDMVNYAKQNNHDVLKGYLYVTNGQKRQIFNRIREKPINSNDVIKKIITLQSTNSDFIVSRKLLLDNKIRYIPEIKIGEDTIITSEIFLHCKNAGYYDSFFLFHTINALNYMNLSSTHHCGDREINDQITAWERTQKILLDISLNYYNTRLHVGLRNLLLSIVHYSNGICEETYHRLNRFCNLTKHFIIGKMNLHKRYDDLYQTILDGNYENYKNIANRRLLIAGYDLKFVKPIIPYLENSYTIQVDEWTGHNAHDKKLSKTLCEWADIIWCEWLLGNAVFYSEMKNENQRLLIRAHRFEISRDFGSQVDYSKIDMVITVGYYYFEQFAHKFNIPRAKMRLLPNYVDDTIYSKEKSPESRFHIGLIGILPARKGFRRGLELLSILRKADTRYKLIVMGQRPSEVSWIKNNPEEMVYFSDCENYIKENALSESIIYGGYRQRNELYYDIGFVLSLSDPEFPESFHLTPAEGACSGAMGLLLRWPGVEYIYPPDVIFDTIDDISKHILYTNTDITFYTDRTSKLRDYIIEHYGIDRFIKMLNRYLIELAY